MCNKMVLSAHIKCIWLAQDLNKKGNRTMTWESDDVLGDSSYLQGIPPENTVLWLVAKKKYVVSTMQKDM